MSKHMGALRGIVIATLAATASIAFAATPAQEKAFVDNYRKAFETKDAKALQAFLYTKGADPRALEFYKMMLVPDADDKLTSITLVDLTAEDVKKLAEGKTPEGKPMKMNLKPIKKLIIKTNSKTTNGSSSGSSESFIAESDGKLVMPVPALEK